MGKTLRWKVRRLILRMVAFIRFPTGPCYYCELGKKSTCDTCKYLLNELDYLYMYVSTLTKLTMEHVIFGQLRTIKNERAREKAKTELKKEIIDYKKQMVMIYEKAVKPK